MHSLGLRLTDALGGAVSGSELVIAQGKGEAEYHYKVKF
jgi:hypothetical protein